MLTRSVEVGSLGVAACRSGSGGAAGRLTIVGGGRDAWVVRRGGTQSKLQARRACDTWSAGASTSPLGVTAMRHAPVAYEPVFGAIVSILAAALLCFELLGSKSPGTSHTGTAFLLIISAQGIFWGVAQIVGYRSAKRLLANTAPPLLGTALGCVFLGLILASAAVILHELSPDHPSYSLLTGGVSALLLVIGAVAGMRQGIWRVTPRVTPNNRWRGP
jgi:hypothetical protein